MPRDPGGGHTHHHQRHCPVPTTTRWPVLVLVHCPGQRTKHSVWELGTRRRFGGSGTCLRSQLECGNRDDKIKDPFEVIYGQAKTPHLLPWGSLPNISGCHKLPVPGRFRFFTPDLAIYSRFPKDELLRRSFSGVDGRIISFPFPINDFLI